MAERPSGTVTFLFTDVEGSTRLWEEYPTAMQAALERHDEIVRSAIESHGGFVFTTAGDAFSAAFARAGNAVAAAETAQAVLSAESWPETARIRIRVSVHTGEAQERDGDYFGPALNRAARIMSAGHGGQTLVSSATAGLLDPDGLVDLGEHRLKDLSARERLFQLGDERFPALRSLETVRHNLPVERTPLVGRNDDMDHIAGLLVEHRLVTLLGIGGTGKTRLAAAVAAELGDRFADGVWFVDLVPAAGAAQVAEVIATAAGLSVSGPDLVEALAELISDRDMLVVLDNCEHITDDVADVVDVLLERTIGPRFMATSREPLQLLDERQVHVSPLAVDDDSASPAVELFTITAERAGAHLERDQLNLVARICTQLDGLPLAIELAAAQLRQYTPAELADRLDQRFELLARGRGGRRRRQASLQAVLEDTWTMLDTPERELLMLVAAFPSSFAAEDVEEAAGDLDRGHVGRTLAGLVDRSVVFRQGDGRHRLLETVKLFAQQQWRDADDPLRYVDRHSRWVLDHLNSCTTQDWYTSAELARWTLSHYEDHRAVEDRQARAGATDELAQLLTALTYTYNQVGAAQATAVIDRINRYLREFGSLTDQQRGLLNLVAGIAGLPARQPDAISGGCQRAITLLDNDRTPEALGVAYMFHATMTALRDTDAAIDLVDEGVAIARAGGATVVADMVSTFRAASLALGGRIDEAIVELDRLRPLLDQRSAFDYSRSCFDTNELVALITRDPPASQAAAIRASAYHDYIGGSGHSHWPSLALAASAAAANGDVVETKNLLDQAKTEAQATGDDPLPDLLAPIAALAWATNQPTLASRWLTAIRRSPTPTQGYYITTIYRQLRNEVGLLDHNPLDNATIDDIYREATDWLADLETPARGRSAGTSPQTPRPTTNL